MVRKITHSRDSVNNEIRVDREGEVLYLTNGNSMKVEVRLFAYFDRYLPSMGKRKRTILDLPESAKAETIIKQLGIPENEGDYMPYVMLVNGVQAHPHTQLNEGDVVSIFPPLAGGKEKSLTERSFFTYL